MKISVPTGLLRSRWHTLTWIAVLACAMSSLAAGARADNPIVQTIYTADPAPWCTTGGCTSTPVMTRTVPRTSR